ncbi:hypothetical protein HID58_046161 [Brassica napus]|uniref:BnaC02g12130D protein n=3 Tax=Brassica TaxID=3705 RepID=A0A078HVE3_BRANA|nr:hypothetical protein HID58_046161 [Brassica napus]CAF1893859.1 unnamed protein product [Brassica napus]CDY41802.1 BnaC02g12130D [Brassica napus]VDD21239.1 unnamed protein product [Brassica oleracea]
MELLQVYKCCYLMGLISGLKPEEISGINNDFAEPGTLAPIGLFIGGTKYMLGVLPSRRPYKPWCLVSLKNQWLLDSAIWSWDYLIESGL